MALWARYQVAMESPYKLIGVDGLEVVEVLGFVPTITISSPQIVRGLPEMNTAVVDLNGALAGLGIEYAIQGSCAAYMRGANMSSPPGDIDVLANKLINAEKALIASGRFDSCGGGTMLVKKLKHKNGTPIDLGDSQDLLPLWKSGKVGGVPVFTIPEVLVSLLLRPETREKEITAFASLLLANESQLTEPDKKSIQEAARIQEGRMRKTSPANLPLMEWVVIVDNAKKAAAQYKLPV